MPSLFQLRRHELLQPALPARELPFGGRADLEQQHFMRLVKGDAADLALCHASISNSCFISSGCWSVRGREGTDQLPPPRSPRQRQPAPRTEAPVSLAS